MEEEGRRQPSPGVGRGCELLWLGGEEEPPGGPPMPWSPCVASVKGHRACRPNLPHHNTAESRREGRGEALGGEEQWNTTVKGGQGRSARRGGGGASVGERPRERGSVHGREATGERAEREWIRKNETLAPLYIR